MKRGGGGGGNPHQLLAVNRSSAHLFSRVLGHLSTDGSGTKVQGILVASAALGVPGACQGRAAILWGIQGIIFWLILPWPAQEDQCAGFMSCTLQCSTLSCLSSVTSVFA